MFHRFGKAFIYAVTATAFGLSIASAAGNFTLHGYDSESAFAARSLFYRDGKPLLPVAGFRIGIKTLGRLRSLG